MIDLAPERRGCTGPWEVSAHTPFQVSPLQWSESRVVGVPGSPRPCLVMEPGDEAMLPCFVPQFPWLAGRLRPLLSLRC